MDFLLASLGRLHGGRWSNHRVIGILQMFYNPALAMSFTQLIYGGESTEFERAFAEGVGLVGSSNDEADEETSRQPRSGSRRLKVQLKLMSMKSEEFERLEVGASFFKQMFCLKEFWVKFVKNVPSQAAISLSGGILSAFQSDFFPQGLTYADLWSYALVHYDMICIGLYLLERDTEFRKIKKSHRGKRYVASNPPGHVRLHNSDMIYVLMPSVVV